MTLTGVNSVNYYDVTMKKLAKVCNYISELALIALIVLAFVIITIAIGQGYTF